MLTIVLAKFLMALMGVLVGIVFGGLPGMTATMAIAIFLPITYAYSLDLALYLLIGLYIGGVSGGLIPAILINIPGTPSSICTTFDGYPMAKRNEGERALKIGITASLFGALISLVILYFFTPPLARVAIHFSSIEKFLIILFALTIIAALSKGNMLKGIFSGFVGVFIALIGQFADNNKMRMIPDLTYFKVNLRSGFQLLPVLIGVFAIVQVLTEAENGMRDTESAEWKTGGQKFSWRDFKGQFINVIRSSLIGTFVGILPGVGGSAASLLSYSQAKNFSKHPEKFGTGITDGVIASECSNNAMTGGAFIPLLSLGIPGDSTTAVLIGAFMLQGIQVGPLFIGNNPELWKSIIFALVLCNILMFFCMFFPIKYIARIINLPKARIFPVILLMCIVGAYQTRSGNMFDVWTMLAFGVFAYVLTKIKLIMVPPMFIGFILGSDLEKYFVDSIKGSGGSLACFFQRPIGNFIWLLIAASIGWAIYDNIRGKKKTVKSAEADMTEKMEESMED